MYIKALNIRQRARLARVYHPSAEDEKLAPMISFKKPNYLLKIHKKLRSRMMKLMVFIITTKGNNMLTRTNDEDHSIELEVKLKVCVLNQILESTLRGIEICANSEAEDRFAGVILNLWDGQGFENVIGATTRPRRIYLSD